LAIGSAFVCLTACSPDEGAQPVRQTDIEGGSAAAASAVIAAAIPPGDWRMINRDLSATRYSPLADINRDNVASLERAWSYALDANSTAVPIVIDGVMFLPSRDRVVALDSETGTEIWSQQLGLPAAADSAGNAPTASTRGVSYWSGDETHAARILLMAGSNLLALDAASGVSVTDFGLNGVVDVGVRYGGTPTRHARLDRRSTATRRG
jgi:glucose dehydrogenase